jgi:large subunit ribosomal protein L28
MLTFERFVKACDLLLRGLPQEGSPMASVCDICGKKPSFGMNVSHSHRRTKRRWNPNVQRVRAMVDGAPKRMHVCTSCIRAGKVTKPPRRTYEPSPTS